MKKLTEFLFCNQNRKWLQIGCNSSCVTKGTISCRCSLLHISVFWLTVIYYKISWVRADRHSGILVTHSIYIHINISVWDFIYLSIIAVKFCNI